MRTLFIFTLLILSHFNYFSQTGEIKGVVVEKETNEPLFGANIKILIDSNIIGTISDFDGNFSLKNIPNGSRLMKISFISKKPINRQINIESNRLLNLDTLFLIMDVKTSCGRGCSFGGYSLNFGEPQRIEIQPEISGSIGTYIISLQYIFEKEIQNDFISSRSKNKNIYLDGIKLNSNTPKIPSEYFKSVFIYKGGLPAKYGDTKNGVIIIETNTYFEVLRRRQNRRYYE